MKCLFENIKDVVPPGCNIQILDHPHYPHIGLELSLFNDHRYAFYFWNRWTQKYGFEQDRITYAPSLVTLDWHQDLKPPTTNQKKLLRNLDLTNKAGVALYSWANLGEDNDTHIMAAAYLNIIGDVYVHCRQGSNNEWKDEHIKDRYGNIHTIKKFKKFIDLESYLLNSGEQGVYFDIDLDFFTISNPLSWGQAGSSFTYLPDRKIREMLNPDRPLISWVLQRLWGFTIALEPEFTGGLLKSHKYLNILDQLYFKPSLFTHHSKSELMKF